MGMGMGHGHGHGRLLLALLRMHMSRGTAALTALHCRYKPTYQWFTLVDGINPRVDAALALPPKHALVLIDIEHAVVVAVEEEHLRAVE